MKDLERVEQGVNTLETIGPVAKDAVQYLTGTNHDIVRTYR